MWPKSDFVWISVNYPKNTPKLLQRIISEILKNNNQSQGQTCEIYFLFFWESRNGMRHNVDGLTSGGMTVYACLCLPWIADLLVSRLSGRLPGCLMCFCWRVDWWLNLQSSTTNSWSPLFRRPRRVKRFGQGRLDVTFVLGHVSEHDPSLPMVLDHYASSMCHRLHIQHIRHAMK